MFETASSVIFSFSDILITSAENLFFSTLEAHLAEADFSY